MSDYLVTDTELTSIANAIRTKGGTSASLEFPTEFVSAINDIQTGGGGYDPYNLETSQYIAITEGSIDFANNSAVINLNQSTRKGVTSLVGSPNMYTNNSAHTLIDGVHLIEIPSGAVQVRTTFDKACQYAIREYFVDNNEATRSVATTSWISVSANVPNTVTLTSGTTHLGGSLRVDSSSTVFNILNTPEWVKVEFIKGS